MRRHIPCLKLTCIRNLEPKNTNSYIINRLECNNQRLPFIGYLLTKSLQAKKKKKSNGFNEEKKNKDVQHTF